MKCNIKIFSSLLALSIIMTPFSAFAYTETPASEMIEYIYEFDVGDFVETAGNNQGDSDADVERINFLNQLGIWDDTSKSPNTFLTVGEFVKVISKVGGGMAGVYLNDYKGMDENSNVAYGTMLEVLLKMLGYYYKCEQSANKESALLNVAHEIGLIGYDTKSTSSFVTRAEFAKIIENAIGIDICLVEYTGGGYRYNVTKDKTILSTTQDIYDLSGFANAIVGFSVYGGGILREGYMEINGVAVDANGFDSAKYVGRMVKAYAKYNESTGIYKLIYISFDNENGKHTEIDFNDIEAINGDTISYVDGQGETHRQRLSNYKIINENGKMLSSISQMSNYATNDGKIIFTSSTKNGDYDVAIIYKYNYYVVKYSDSFQKRVGLEYGAKFDNKDYIQIDEDAHNYVTVDGIVSEYTQIPANSAMRVFRNNVTGYTYIEAVTKKLAGSVDMVDGDTIVMAGKKYNVSKDLIKRIQECASDVTLPVSKKIDYPNVGEKITAYAFGNIIVGYKTGQDYIYAYLKSAKKVRNEETSDRELVLRAYTQEREWIDLKLHKKLTLDGERVTEAEATDTIISNKDNIVGKLIRFKTNSSDKAIDIDTIIETPSELAKDDDLAYATECAGGATIKFKHSWDNWSLKETNYVFNKTAPIFVIPKNDSREDKYKVVSPTSFTKDEYYDVVLYNPDSFMRPSAIVFSGDLSVSTDNKERWLYVTKILKKIDDEDGDIKYEIVGMGCGPTGLIGVGSVKEEKYIIDEDDYDNKPFQKGDLMYIVYRGDKLEQWEFDKERTVISDGSIIGATGITAYRTIDSNSYMMAVGTVEEVDLTGDPLIVINCGASGKAVYMTSGRVIIDLGDNNKLKEASLSEFHEGDKVLGFVNGRYCGLLIKNVN